MDEAEVTVVVTEAVVAEAVNVVPTAKVAGVVDDEGKLVCAVVDDPTVVALDVLAVDCTAGMEGAAVEEEEEEEEEAGAAVDELVDALCDVVVVAKIVTVVVLHGTEQFAVKKRKEQ